MCENADLDQRDITNLRAVFIYSQPAKVLDIGENVLRQRNFAVFPSLLARSSYNHNQINKRSTLQLRYILHQGLLQKQYGQIQIIFCSCNGTEMVQRALLSTKHHC